jgi:SAM-dependent methyltransferase
MNTTTPLCGPDGRHSCRSCGSHLRPFLDLGASPLCQAFLTKDQLGAGEAIYPLEVHVCTSCWLVQLGEFVAPQDIFGEYAYFASFSVDWLEHARGYVDMAITRFGLGSASFVIELASNDGYLLRNFVAKGVPCLGIEPAANVAAAAEAIGVRSLVRFFDRELGGQLADEGKQADLVVANNVLAQVPDLNGFLAGVRKILRPEGVLTIEFPHLVRLLDGNQFDTIYHEHFSYFSLMALEHMLSVHRLRVFDVEELWTHGGSLRVYCCRTESVRPEERNVASIRAAEEAAGLRDMATYAAFAARTQETKFRLLELLIRLKRQGHRIVGYGAPGKGNTLLNYCGIRTDFVDFTVDRNPYKQGRFLPGTRIPVLAPEHISEIRPDYVLILPWNLKDEIMRQLAYVRDWGGKFVIPIPDPTIFE